jgi:hypothetical protein
MFNYDENVTVGSSNTIYNSANGVIIDRVAQIVDNQPKIKPLYYSYPRIETLTSPPNDTVNDYTFYKTQDGSLIRLFYHCDEWNVATNMHPDATRSKFRNDTSFYDLFIETMNVCGLSFDTLNKNHCYTLLMINPNNSTVFTHTVHSLVLLCVYDLINDCEIPNTLINGLCNMQLATPTDVQLTVVPNASMTGYLMVHNSTGVRYRIELPIYKIMKQLRGKRENPVVQILELNSTGQLETFIKCYPEQLDNVRDTLAVVDRSINSLLDSYVSYYIKKEVKNLHYDTNCRTLLYNLHQQYKRSRNDNNVFKVNYIRVRQAFMTLDPDVQYSIIMTL